MAETSRERPGGPSAPARQRHRILMACDFFYPNVGGIENHIYQLSQCLLARGHKVCCATGSPPGLRSLPNTREVVRHISAVIVNEMRCSRSDY